MLAYALLATSVWAQSFYQPEPVQIATFGYAVAVGPDYILVGEHSGFKDPGTVHRYVKDTGGEWVNAEYLQALDRHVGDGFGQVLALDGNTLVVASREAVYIFEYSGDYETFEEVMRLEHTANALTIDGSWLAIGAGTENRRTGAVYVYKRNGDTADWELSTVLNGEESGSYYGAAVALDGNRLAVGVANANTAKVYHWDDDSWVEEATLHGDNYDVQTSFGSTLHMSEDRLAIGAPRSGEGTGAVIVLQWGMESGWNKLASISPEESEPFLEFGSAAKIVEHAVWVGTPGANRNAGQLYRFDYDDATDNWTLGQLITSPSGAERGQFGASFDVYGEVAVVGMPGSAYGEGRAMVLEKGDNWAVTADLFNAGETMAPVLDASEICAQGRALDYDCGLVDLLSFLPLHDMDAGRGVRLNDVWGWTDPVTDSEYALVGHLEGTVFVNVTDPLNPLYLGTLPRTEGSPGSTWRDIKVYKDHAFIVADGAGAHGMQIFDLTQLRDLQEMPITFKATAHYDRIFSSHNIVINEDTGYAYAVGASGGGETCGGGLHMIDIREPLKPVFAGCFADETTGRRKTGYSHDAQCVIYHGPDTEHQGKEICFGANETAISIADVTDKANPVAIGSGQYPDAAYVHQGWLSEDHGWFYQNDELDELIGRAEHTRTLVWDVRDLEDPQMVKEYFGPTSATDHNLYVHGNLMYQTNNASGLRVIDITTPDDPVEVGFFDTTPYGTDESGFNGTWSSYPYFESGIIVVTSRREGLFILKKQTVDT